MNRTDLFFIVGTGRCGTTLLQVMLSQHGRLHVPPETNFFAYWDPDRYGPGAAPGRRFSDEAQVLEHIRWASGMRFWGDLSLDENRLARDAMRLGANAKGLFLAMMEQFQERADKPRLGEKTPIHHKSVERIRELFPDAQFIFMYRDPRDTTASMLEHDWGGHGSAFRHAKTWRRAMRMHRERESAMPAERYTALRYESLIDSPREELSRLCAFLGEEFDEGMLEAHKRRDPGFDSREMNWKGMTLEPVSKKRIGRFKEKMTPLQIWTIERICGDEIERCGYERDQPRRGKLGWKIALAGEWLRLKTDKLRRSVRRRLGLESKDLPETRMAAAKA